MSEVYGIESQKSTTPQASREKVRYVIVIESGGVPIARLLLDNREQVNEIDAGALEITQMISGITPTRSASGREWDMALMGHSLAERAAAEVYALDV